MLLNYNPRDCLPSAEDLPDSDDTNENGYIGMINRKNAI